MNEEEKREKLIQFVADLMRQTAVSFEFVVRKKPKGIKISYEVTQEEMDALMSKRDNKNNEKNS